MDDLKKIALDKNLAKLGDNLVNLMYSLALTWLFNKADGKKVSDKVLAKALHEAGLRKLLPKRLTTHERGDAVEAILAYFWLNGEITVKKGAEILLKNLTKQSVKNREIREREAVKAFKVLLEQLLNL